MYDAVVLIPYKWTFSDCVIHPIVRVMRPTVKFDSGSAFDASLDRDGGDDECLSL
jgi:hypothetical protein